ncbi:MAG: pantoate--beta-alanine ligase [Candidatus Omnitrophica bacterium]|nr:pantoate--beta-alanine ligase [Candidatus Omnitrophota bacterium]
MLITADIAKVRRIIQQARLKGKKVGFVPTMGALHQGHLSLVKASNRQSDFTVVSIFVNPLQFGPKEDLKKYPRRFKPDRKLLKKEKVDLLFYPSAKDLYPKDFSISVSEGQLSKFLCGISRPGHFKGVCTVVTKLFNIIQPDQAYFGQKDCQQARIIRRLVRDLNFPLEIKVLPTVRESDGLALSSRNQYLNPKQRKDARVIYQALRLAKKDIQNGQRNPARIIKAMRQRLSSVKSLKIDYLEIANAESLNKLKTIKGKVLITLAVYLAKVRLIDNIILNVD